MFQSWGLYSHPQSHWIFQNTEAQTDNPSQRMVKYPHYLSPTIPQILLRCFPYVYFHVPLKNHRFRAERPIDMVFYYGEEELIDSTIWDLLKYACLSLGYLLEVIINCQETSCVKPQTQQGKSSDTGTQSSPNGEAQSHVGWILVPGPEWTFPAPKET